MADVTIDRSGADERSRLIRLGIILLDVYVLIAVAVIYLQSSAARLPAEIAVAPLIPQGAAFEIGVAAAVRRPHDLSVVPTRQGVVFMARQACPGRLSAAARDAWIAEFMAGYQSAVAELRPTVASVAGQQLAVESSNR